MASLFAGCMAPEPAASGAPAFDYDVGILPETFVPGFHDPAEVRKMKYRRLDPCVNKDGFPMHVSILSFGASSLGGCFRDDTTLEEGVKVVHAALKSGINLIDVGPTPPDSPSTLQLAGAPPDARAPLPRLPQHCSLPAGAGASVCDATIEQLPGCRGRLRRGTGTARRRRCSGRRSRESRGKRTTSTPSAADTSRRSSTCLTSPLLGPPSPSVLPGLAALVASPRPPTPCSPPAARQHHPREQLCPALQLPPRPPPAADSWWWWCARRFHRANRLRLPGHHPDTRPRVRREAPRGALPAGAHVDALACPGPHALQSVERGSFGSRIAIRVHVH